MINELSMIQTLEAALSGKPLDQVGPALVVAVARALVADAAGDEEKLGYLIVKFNHHLHLMIDEMTERPAEATLQ